MQSENKGTGETPELTLKEKLSLFYDSLNEKELPIITADNRKELVKTKITKDQNARGVTSGATMEFEGYPGANANSFNKNYVFIENKYSTIIIDNIRIKDRNLAGSGLFMEVLKLIAKSLPQGLKLEVALIHDAMTGGMESILKKITDGRLTVEQAEQMLMKHPFAKMMIEAGFKSLTIEPATRGQGGVKFVDVTAKKPVAKTPVKLKLTI